MLGIILGTMGGFIAGILTYSFTHLIELDFIVAFIVSSVICLWVNTTV
jgi:uncharacterized membrane protein YeaQ/YmgE (transglycosylase-associated protein family)